MSAILQTGKDWCDALSISILDKLSVGFGTRNYFFNHKISKEEFLNRVSHCKIKTYGNASRKEIELKRKELYSIL